MSDSDPLPMYVAYATGGLSLLWLLLKGVKYHAFKSKIDAIPTIGYSGALTSYFSAFKSIKNTRDLVQEGYYRFNTGLFKIPTLNDWLVVVSDPKMMEELKKAPDDQISFKEASRELIQVDYTLGVAIHHDPYHAEVVKSTLTRSIPAVFADVRDESLAAFQDNIPVTEDWVKVPAMDTILEIVCRTSNRIFVGLPLCREPDYKNLNVQFTINVMVTANIINLFPNFLKYVVGNSLSSVEKDIQRAIKHVRPMIEERFAKIEEYGRDYPDKPNDMLSWLIDEANTSERRSVREITIRLLATNFAAIHTTSMGFTTTLYHLAAHPEYAKELREEVESAIAEYGWSKTGMQQLRKMDSFMKEAQRLHASSGAVVMIRKVMKDFTFSNGYVVPAGCRIALASDAVHRDENLYSDPTEFKPFRFSDMRSEEGESHKHQIAALGSDYLLFGYGRHACPGRFFAVNEVKAFVAHVLLTYDVKMEDGKVPPLEWYGTMSTPNRSAHVMFRKRRE